MQHQRRVGRVVVAAQPRAARNRVALENLCPPHKAKSSRVAALRWIAAMLEHEKDLCIVGVI